MQVKPKPTNVGGEMKQNRFNAKAKFLSLAAIGAISIATLVPIQSASAANEIRFMSWAWQDTHIAVLKNIVAQWNKANPSTPAKLELVDEEGLYTQLSTGFLAGTAPDVIDTEAAAALQYARSGYLYNLAPDLRYLQKEINPGVWTTASYKAKLFGAPWMIEQYMVVANVDLFKKLGVAVPKQTDTFTWDDLRALAKKVTTADMPGIGVGLGSAAKLTMVMGPTVGAKYFTGVTTGAKARLIQGAPELEIVKTINDMIQVDKSLSSKYVSTSPQSDFQSGKLPLMFTKNSLANTLDTGPKVNYAYLPMVSGSGGAKQAPTAGIYAVSAQSKQIKNSVKFLKFLMDGQNLAQTNIAVGGSIPGTTSGQNAIKALKTDSNWQFIMSQGLNLTTAPFLFVPQWESWKGSFQNPQAKLLYTGKITLDGYKKAITDGWNGLR
jgi:ABC-type glycerol-3-phosphate transport system substrate-binding protein